MSRGVAGSLIPAGRALEVGVGGKGSGTAGAAAVTPLAASGKIQGTPDWWLATLPGQKGVRVVNRYFEQSFNASASNTQIDFIDVNAGETLVMLRYRFFAITPGIGGRRELVGEVDLAGYVVWRLLLGNMDMLEYSYAKSLNGMAMTHSQLQDGFEPIPLFVTGKNRFRFVYTVASTVLFTVSTVGFHLYGCIVPTKTLDDIAKR